MSGKTISSAIILLIIGNFIATLCDAFIKLAGTDIPVFQFSFMRALCMVLCLLPFMRQINWDKPFEGAKIHFLRGNIWVLASVLLVIALGALPLATANAVFYTAPLFIIMLSAFFFKEKLTLSIVLAGVAGFIGVLIILRPTQFSWGMASAVLFALTLAMSSLLIRCVPKTQSLVHSLFMTQVFALPVSAGLALWEGQSWHIELWVFAIGSAICSILYSMTCLLAYRHVASSEIASAEYSGLISAMFVGWLWFNEAPDVLVGVGALLIIAPLAYISHVDNKRRRQFLHNTATL